MNTTLTDLHEYLAQLLKNTNMKSLTPEKAMSGECGFMAANLYAKSIFGEDALANVSLEKNPQKPDAPVTGKPLAQKPLCLLLNDPKFLTFKDGK